MKIHVGALLLVGLSCGAVTTSAAATLGRCRARCREVRQGVLDDVGVCLPAFKIPPAQKFYHACVDGRRRAFDRACAPLCAGAVMTVTSFEACRAAGKHGQKSVDWCRRGYDSILLNPEAFSVEPSATEETQQELVEELDVPTEVESAESESAPSEPVDAESTQKSRNMFEGEPVSESVRIAPHEADVVEIDTVQNDVVHNEPVETDTALSESVHGDPAREAGNAEDADEEAVGDDEDADDEDAAADDDDNVVDRHEKLTLRGMKVSEL